MRLVRADGVHDRAEGLGVSCAAEQAGLGEAAQARESEVSDPSMVSRLREISSERVVREVAGAIFDALKIADPGAYVGGDPRGGGETVIDGSFDLLAVVRQAMKDRADGLMLEAAAEIERQAEHIAELRMLCAEAVGRVRYLEACQDPGFRGEGVPVAQGFGDDR